MAKKTSTKKKEVKTKVKLGRPTVMTPEVLDKLQEAFAFGCTDKEACFYAGISEDSLYEYCSKNPEFSERKEALKDSPVLKARKTVYDNLDDPDIAKWLLERKRKEEYSIKIENTNENINYNSEELTIDELRTLQSAVPEIEGEEVSS